MMVKESMNKFSECCDMLEIILVITKLCLWNTNAPAMAIFFLFFFFENFDLDIFPWLMTLNLYLSLTSQKIWPMLKFLWTNNWTHWQTEKWTGQKLYSPDLLMQGHKKTQSKCIHFFPCMSSPLLISVQIYCISVYSLLLTTLNPFPKKPWFLRVCSTSLLKTQWEKENLLVTSNFSFFHSFFYPFRKTSTIFINFKIVVCELFQLESKICCLGKV